MYVVTFYSYKGGVGRTMALVNIAFELSKRGRNVLVVDFDLEAPGISTYPAFEAASRSEGIVDYVNKYISTGEAPDVREYVVKCSVENAKAASVWIMPAGKRDRAYGNKLAAIDWQKLYDEHEGFLMFEDLKLQWSNSFSPKMDYVLIDSRTGHTDVGGICTRQLPDAVVLMFYPNIQNIAGVCGVVEEIRIASKELEIKKRLLFCPSNVPDLDDDEEEILQSKLEHASDALGYKKPSSIIHHYNSLDLVDQKVFVLDRPRTKLAKEYSALCASIVESNIEDRDGALMVLRSILDEIKLDQSERGRKRKGELSLKGVQEQITKIERYHEDDGEVSWYLASYYDEIGDIDGELKALNKAIERNYLSEQARRARAKIYLRQEKKELAKRDLLYVITSDDASTIDLVRSLRMLSDSEFNWLEMSEVISALDRVPLEDKVQLTDAMVVSRFGSRMAADILTKVRALNKGQPRDSYQVSLVTSLIGSLQFKEAIETFEKPRTEILKSEEIIETYNYAMAEWGLIKRPPIDLFSRSMELASDGERRGLNFNQCLAIACAVLGASDKAKFYIKRSREMLDSWPPVRIFSSWRYLNVSQDEMTRDLQEIEASLKQPSIKPAFIVDASRR